MIDLFQHHGLANMAGHDQSAARGKIQIEHHMM
jgi:hypothetical protein